MNTRGVPARLARDPRRVYLAGAAAILAGTALAIAFTIWLGHARYGNPKKTFGEFEAGTFFSCALLGASAGVAAWNARRASAPSLRRAWFRSAWLFVFLALDDLLMIHEHLDWATHWLLGWDPENSLTDRLDDLIVATYWIVFGVIWWPQRRFLAQSRWMAIALAAAFAVYAAMVAAEAAHLSKVIEDSLKLVAEALILIGFLGASVETTYRSSDLYRWIHR